MKNLVLSLIFKRGVKVGLVGVGKSNLGVLDFLSRVNPSVKITLRQNKEISTECISHERAFWGEEIFSNIDEDILFLSPSVRRDKPELIRATAHGTLLFSDVELFSLLSTHDAFGVTGSDGKSTTTYLASRLLASSYERAIPAANFGEALTPHLFDGEKTAFVLELSSFQLMYATPRTRRCVITNITENHLNWHLSFEEYVFAKKRILDRSQEAVFGYDSPTVRDIARTQRPFALFSSRTDEEGMRRDIKAENYLSLKDGYIILNGSPLFDTSRMVLSGRHNTENFMAAIALTLGKCKTADIESLAESFGGLPHRAELIATLDGVRYVNSSIDTTPARCVATLASQSRPVVLILGGRSKGLDFSPIAEPAAKKARAVILTGECQDEIYKALCESDVFRSSKIPVFLCDTLCRAVNEAKKIARRGDTVLLSPAATSYDAFSSFEERGAAFRRAVLD